MSRLFSNSMTMSRRTFLKLAATTGAGVALGTYLRSFYFESGLFEQPWNRGPGIESMKLSICRQCPAGCGLRVRIVDGDAKKLDGNPLCPVSRGTLCPKGQAGLEDLYNPDRLMGPVRRSGKRGENKWTRISWDEALTEVRNRLVSLREQGNPQNIAWIAERNDALEGEIIRRFMRAYGSPNLWEFVDLRDESARAAAYFCQGVNEFPAYDFANASCILSFGTPLLESWFSPTMMTRNYGHLHRGRQFRGRLVQIESRLSPTAVKADEWIPIEPGTEAALALAVAHELIREGLYDHSFVSQNVSGLDDWTDAAGKIHDGFRTMVLRDYIPHDVASITGVPVTTILRLAREISSSKPAIIVGEQVPYSGGVALAWAVHILNALCGSVDVRGGLLTQLPLPVQPLPEVSPDDAAKHGLANPLKLGIEGKFPTGAPVMPLLPEAGLNTLQALFISSSRFFAVSPEAGKIFSSVDKIPFIVSFSSVFDDSAAFSDLILPDHSPLEKWQSVVPLPTDGTALWSVTEPALEPLLDTRHITEVIMDIGKSVGGSVAAAFPWKDVPEILEYSAAGLFASRRGAPFAAEYDDSWLNQLETGGWWVPSAETREEFWQQVIQRGGWYDPVYPYGQTRRIFRTPSEKFEFVSKHLEEKFQQPVADNILMPKYSPPEWAGSEKEFPLMLKSFTVLTTGQLEDPNQPFLLETLAPQVYARWESWIELNPETAKRLDVSNNEWVVVESPAGQVRLPVKLFAGAMPNVASVIVGNEHRAGGLYAIKASPGAADLVAYKPDPSGLSMVPMAASTRLRLRKETGGA